MTENLVILVLFVLLFGIVSLRFCFLLHSIKNQDEREYEWDDEEWADADYIRHSKYYED